MSAFNRPNLGALCDWIQSTDHHAAHHLKLVEQVDQILAGQVAAASGQRLALSAKLERWRYQHFNERAPELSTQDTRLLDALDLSASALAGRTPRQPRRTAEAIWRARPASAHVGDCPELLEGDLSQQDLIQRATEITDRNFRVSPDPGVSSSTARRMLMYAPLYISNECINHCTYCGFRHPLEIDRQHLTVEQALAEARLLRQRGFRHLVVVAGDFPSRTTTEYFCSVIQPLVRLGIQPAIEIAPQSTQSYARLVAAGVSGLTLYQETYDERRYGEYHVRGPKSSYHWRLEGHDRAAEAGVQRLGLGVLLGLAPPVDELRALIRHGMYLIDRFPECTLAFSLPRIHEAPSNFTAPFSISDDQLIRYYCVLRVVFPNAELVLSTRESARLRNRLARICITQISAGSSTSPGGYRDQDQDQDQSCGQQFPVADQRSPADVAEWLQAHELHPVWSIASF